MGEEAGAVGADEPDGIDVPVMPGMEGIVLGEDDGEDDGEGLLVGDVDGGDEEPQPATAAARTPAAPSATAIR